MMEPNHIEDIASIESDIAAAEDYERVLAIKMARLRRLVLNLKCKRDALDELGAVLTERRAAA